MRRSFNYLLQFHLGSLVSFPRVPGSGSAAGGVVLLLSAVAVLWCGGSVSGIVLAGAAITAPQTQPGDADK